MVQPLVAPSRFVRVRCLLVEDSEFDQRRMRRVFDQLGVGRLDIAPDAARARGFLAVNRPHLIVIDNSLPDVAGVDLAAELQQSKPLSKIPVALICDWPTPFMYDKAIRAKVCKVLDKDNFNLVTAVDLLKHARGLPAEPTL